MLLWMMLSSVAHAGACGISTSAIDVGDTLREALEAYGELDEDGFLRSAERAEEEVTCLGEVMPIGSAASFHRVMGLRWFVQGDADQAAASFQAAVALEPTGLPSSVAPEGGKLYKFFEEAREAPAPIGESFAFPKGMVAWVDGTRGNQRPDGLPAIVQVDDGGGRVVWSTYVAYQDELSVPAAIGAAAAGEDLAGVEDLDDLDGSSSMLAKNKKPKEPRPAGEKADKPARDMTPVWVGAGVSGGLAAAMYGGAALSRMQFEKEPSAGAFHTTNGAYYGSIGAGVLALGLTGVAIGGSF